MTYAEATACVERHLGDRFNRVRRDAGDAVHPPTHVSHRSLGGGAVEVSLTWLTLALPGGQLQENEVHIVRGDGSIEAVLFVGGDWGRSHA